MTKKIITAAALFCLLASEILSTPFSKQFREALNLYDQGMYERARTKFEMLPPGPLVSGYAALCAGKSNSKDFYALLAAYDARFKSTSLSAQLHYQAALNLFDAYKYSEAAQQFDKFAMKELPKSEAAQYTFKKGFCAFSVGDYNLARERFNELEGMKMSDYTSPERYAQGFMDYTDGEFKKALGWFEKSVKDKRFQDLSNFYIIDCHFMLKDYHYVIDNGVSLYDRVPRERQAHLSRIISESYLVLGQNDKAKEYYLKDKELKSKMVDSDYFYAGSIMYALHDYKGAIENFEKMEDRTDSIGQIANYQLGNCYIQQRNKVAAIDAFKAAVDYSFDDAIKEDASFNHAKLAFDINADGSFFEEYLKNYGTTAKGEAIYGYMALARLVSRDYAGAIDAYEKITNPDSEADRNYLKANYLRAAELIRSGAYSTAVPYLETASYGQSPYEGFTQLSKYWIAECKYNTSDYQGAFSDFTGLYNISALDGEPEGILLPYNIGYSAFKTNQWQTAAKWFDRYVSAGGASNKIDALYRRADCDFAAKDYKAAVVSYGKAIAAESDINKIYPYYQQALSFGLLGKIDDEINVLLVVEKASPSSAMYSQALYELGRCYLDKKNYSKAVALFTRVRSDGFDPGYFDKALLGEGTAIANMGDYDAALSCYKMVVANQHSTDLGKSALAAIESIYQSTGRTQEYIDYIQKNDLDAGSDSKDMERLYFNAAKQSFNASDYAQAAKSLDYYLVQYPDGIYAGQAWYYTGECRERSGQKEKAREAYASVLDCKGEGSYRETSVRNFSRLSYELQQYEDAYGGYKALLEMTRFDEFKREARIGMMLSAYGAKRYKEAIANAELLGDDLQAKYIKAKSHLATSNRKEAFALLNEISENPATPEGAEANYLIVQECYDKGDFNKVADMVYDFAPKAKGQDYWLARCFVTLGDAFCELGNIKQARATYSSLLEEYTPYGEGDDIRVLVNGRLEKIESK